MIRFGHMVVAGCLAPIGITSCSVGDDTNSNEVATVAISGPPEEALISTEDTLIGKVSDLVLAEAVWTVNETPAMSIGGEGSGPASDLFYVRGAVRLEDGRIVVADWAQRLLVFDAEGTHLRTLGREGSGPGEFGAILWMQRLPNDTLLVFDAYNARRLSYFTVDGGFARSIVASRQMLVGALADGTLVASIDLPSSIPSIGPNELWIGPWQLELSRLDVDGSVLNSLGVFPGGDRMVVPGVGTMQLRDSNSPVRSTKILAGSRLIYVATGDRFEVQVFSPEGGNPELIRRDYELVRLTRDGLIEYFAGTRFGDRIPWNSIRENWPEDQTRPAITSLQLDAEGNLWVEEGRIDYDSPGIWHVVGPSGRYLATATMPSRFRPFDIGAESVLGVWRDDLDVEYVQLRAITKSDNP